MSFYDLSKPEREKEVIRIHQGILNEIRMGKSEFMVKIFSDEDTYIRKTGYLALGRIYFAHNEFHGKIIDLMDTLYKSENQNIRQTVINAVGEIGMREFEITERFFDAALFDPHHKVRNAVIGSVKKMGEKNPIPVLNWARKYLHHEEKEIRREICHGIELRGRTHPQDILPLLKELQFDKTARVRNTLVHVLGQIAYKKGCLETVIADLKTWENQELVKEAIAEIIDVHNRYKDFAIKTTAEAKEYIEKHYSFLN